MRVDLYTNDGRRLQVEMPVEPLPELYHYRMREQGPGFGRGAGIFVPFALYRDQHGHPVYIELPEES